jgi:hypothetical protein
MNVSLGTTSIVFTTTTDGNTSMVTLMRSTVRVLMGPLAHENTVGRMEALPFLKLLVNAEPITEGHVIAWRKLFDLAIDAVELDAVIEWGPRA